MIAKVFRKISVVAVFASALTGLVTSSAVMAQESPVLLPEGQTLITLQVTERVEVAQDLLVADLRIEAENQDAMVVQNDINEAMEGALELARAVDGIDVSTGYYGVHQVNRQPQGGRPDRVWRGSQHINLQGQSAQAILDLAGELQTMGFVMNQLSYQLSTEKADEVRDTLMEAAIERATAKAERAAQALGKGSVDIASLNVDTSSNYAPPRMMRTMAMAADAEMATPAAEAGETEVSLTVRIQAVAK